MLQVAVRSPVAASAFGRPPHAIATSPSSASSTPTPTPTPLAESRISESPRETLAEELTAALERDAAEQAELMAAHATYTTEETWIDAEDDDDDDAADSDYVPEEDDEDTYEEDDDVLRWSLERELDQQVDEVSDYYLKRMLEARERLELAPEDQAWVDKYIAAQAAWKAEHGRSIDEMDLDLRLARRRRRQSKMKTTTKTLEGPEAPMQLPAMLVDAWHGRVSPLLPAALRKHRPDQLLSMIAVAGFVAVALGIQFYVTFQAPRYT